MKPIWSAPAKKALPSSQLHDEFKVIWPGTYVKLACPNTTVEGYVVRKAHMAHIAYVVVKEFDGSRQVVYTHA